eukprot:4868192-Prymnesium_polylepis.1
MRESERGVILNEASASRLIEAMTAPEWRVSLNSRNAIIGAASTNCVSRGLPVLPAVKSTSGSRIILSRMQKKDARQLGVDQMSHVEPANGSPNLSRRTEMAASSFWSVSERAMRKILTLVSRGRLRALERLPVQHAPLHEAHVVRERLRERHELHLLSVRSDPDLAVS